ncbi:phosphatidate cytidylyltransferase [Brevibacterium sp. UBA7493]|uniref:phosphatidate cytidylyltransferase n=1 Tax=Brevibacterium sp. UBA7493 TaxID=1946121 RepID=UPI00257EC65E|nr:phosphatidate cytidylyltransferase [Brevibacterium sp. UBA7493]
MAQQPVDGEKWELYTQEFPRRRDAIRAEREAARTGQLPVIQPAPTPPAQRTGNTAAGAEAQRQATEAQWQAADEAQRAEEQSQATETQPHAVVGSPPASAYGHGLVTPTPEAEKAAEATSADTATATDNAPGSATAAEPEKKDYGRAGRNLPAAIAVGAVLGGGVLASLLFYPPSFVVIVLIGVIVAMWELANALSRSGSVVARVPTVTAAGLMILATYLAGREALWVAFTVGAGAILLFTLLERRPNPVKDVCLSLFALTYVGLMASSVVFILTQPDGNLLVILFLALVIASDIGGYTFGVLWGKHPIAPKISPKKSWEGYAGSAVFSTAVGICMALWAFDAPIWTGVVLGTIIPAFATLGDFSESMIKRDLDLKDMGTLLPGHGGVMDRLDSILPTAPVALVLFTFLPGFIT